MNQGRIWTVGKPSIGLPMFLSAIVVTSLIIHYSILTHTTWFPAFMQGGQKKVAIETQSTGPAVASLSDSTRLN